MKTNNVRNLVFGAMTALMGILFIVVCMSTSAANAAEVRRLEHGMRLEEIERQIDILDTYGFEGYAMYRDLDEEFKEEGNLGIGTYEFYYEGSSLYLEAESVNGLHWTLRWVR